jgi:hypothetical protein
MVLLSYRVDGLVFQPRSGFQRDVFAFTPAVSCSTTRVFNDQGSLGTHCSKGREKTFGKIRDQSLEHAPSLQHLSFPPASLRLLGLDLGKLCRCFSPKYDKQCPVYV